MSGAVQPFAQSTNGKGVSLAVTTTSASVTLPTDGGSLLIVNAGPALAFVALAASATLAGLPVPVGTTTLLDVGPYTSVLSAVTAASAATLYLSRGNGSAH